MPLSLQDVQKITDDVARELNPSLAVLAATTAEGGSEYTEVTLTLRGCATEPARRLKSDRRSPL